MAAVDMAPRTLIDDEACIDPRVLAKLFLCPKGNT